MPSRRSTLSRFILFAAQPTQREPGPVSWLGLLAGVFSVLFGDVIAFFFWKFVDAEASNLLIRFAVAFVVTCFVLGTVAGLRLQRLRDEEHTPRIALELNNQPILGGSRGRGVNRQFWLEVVNTSRETIHDVTVTVESLTSRRATYGLASYRGARFRTRVGGSTEPIDIPVGKTPVAWDIVGLSRDAQVSGIVLSCEASKDAPTPLDAHSKDFRYTMIVEVHGRELQALPEHQVTLDFWSEESSGSFGVLHSFKCEVATPGAS